MTWIATSIFGSSLVGAAATAYGASKAAGAQESAAQQAIAAQMQMYQQTQQYLSPYRNLGNYSAGLLQSQLPGLTAPINMDEATLEQTPGYQFNLKQGLKAADNSAAARGLGESGAVLKGASTFATGLADSTYQNQFTNALQNKQFALNALLAPTQVGESAAAGTGSAATSAGQGIAGSLTNYGNAAAAGYNALGTAAGQLGQGAQAYALYNGLYAKNNPGAQVASAAAPASAPFGQYTVEG
jgi:hypothetical protein